MDVLYLGVPELLGEIALERGPLRRRLLPDPLNLTLITAGVA